MLFTFLLIVQTLIAAALVTTILMQRSEGGGLVASSSGSLMTARGAADFLTRATAVLATLFVILSIALAALATVQGAPREIDSSLARQTPAPASPTAPLGSPAAPITGAPPIPNNDPLAGAAAAAGEVPPATAAPAPAAPAPANGAQPKQ